MSEADNRVIRVEMTRTLDDCIRMNRIFYSETEPGRRLWRRSVIGFAAAYGVLFLMVGVANFTANKPFFSVPEYMALFLVSGTLFVLFRVQAYKYDIKRSVKVLAKNADSWFHPCAIELGSEGILVSSKDGRSDLKWTAIQRVFESKEDLVFALGNAMLLTVPKRFFSNPADCLQFLRTAQELKAGAET